MFFDGTGSLDVLISGTDLPIVFFYEISYGLLVDSIFLLQCLVPVERGNSGAQCPMLYSQNTYVTSNACMSTKGYETEDGRSIGQLLVSNDILRLACTDKGNCVKEHSKPEYLIREDLRIALSVALGKPMRCAI